MQVSTEARWFFDDIKMVAPLSKWFGDHNLTLTGASFDRQDYYLQNLRMTNLGLKIREPKRDGAGNISGKMEAKVLINELPVLELKGNNSGTANEWTKFSFNLEQNDRTLTEILQSFSQEGPGPIVKGHHFWVRLDKSRILLKYEPAQNKVFAVDMNIAEGCGIELTAIRINGARYYSFGLESFSESGQQRKNFYATLEFLFSEINITGLSIANSLSYPQFLAANTK